MATPQRSVRVNWMLRTGAGAAGVNILVQNPHATCVATLLRRCSRIRKITRNPMNGSHPTPMLSVSAAISAFIHASPIRQAGSPINLTCDVAVTDRTSAARRSRGKSIALRRPSNRAGHFHWLRFANEYSPAASGGNVFQPIRGPWIILGRVHGNGLHCST